MQIKEKIKETYHLTDKELAIYELGVAKGRIEGVESASKIFDNYYQDSLSKFHRDQFLEATTPASEQDIREKLLEDNWADDMDENNLPNYKITDDVTD